MKIIIEYQGLKREIEGSFGICGSRDDLKRLIIELQGALADDFWSYGWVDVAPRHPMESGKPVPWRQL